MRISFIGIKQIPGKFASAEAHVTELATRLVRAGHQVSVYTRAEAPEGNGLYNGIKIKTMASWGRSFMAQMWQMKLATLHAAVFGRTQVFHFQGSLAAWLTALAKFLRPQSVVVVTLHSLEQHEAKSAVKRWFYLMGQKLAVRFADEIITPNKIVANHFALSYKRYLQYLPNGVNLRRVATDDVVLDPLKLRSFNYALANTTGLSAYELKILIQAWQLAQTPVQQNRQLKLALVGDLELSDEEAREIEALVAVDDSIVFTGFQTGEVLTALLAGSLYVIEMPRQETWPATALTAMSYGKAVILPDAIENLALINEYGLKYRVGQVADLAARIDDLNQDVMQTAALGHQARTFVENEYSWDETALNTLELYEKHQALRDGVLAIR